MKKVIFCGLMTLLLYGCVSLVENTGRALDGSASAEKKIAVYRTAKKDKTMSGMEIWETKNKAGDRACAVMFDKFPAMKIHGTAPDESGLFNLVSLDYLGGNAHGWNEYRLDLFGEGTLKLGEKQAELSIPGGIETVQISWGRIRRYDTRITGNDALTNLRNRYERIQALTEWMNSREDSPAGLNPDDFEKYWKPILFPEMLKKKKQPEGWRMENDQFVKAEDIQWNTGYTERVFPELLRDIRNSGTLLRDWEEAIDWIYIDYEWDRIRETLAKETAFTLSKRKK